MNTSRIRRAAICAVLAALALSSAGCQQVPPYEERTIGLLPANPADCTAADQSADGAKICATKPGLKVAFLGDQRRAICCCYRR